MITALLFAGGLLLIVIGSELFTNAVEWAGYRLKLASGATGSLLAALGTALPETAVPVVALIGRNPTSDAVVTCTSGLVRYSMAAAAPARLGAPLAIERPATTAM